MPPIRFRACYCNPLIVFIAAVVVLTHMPSSVRANEPLVADFDMASAGSFSQLTTAIGTWKREAGQTLVDSAHAKSGRHCLQLSGGEFTSVILELAPEVDPSGDLRFWAERWTSRAPFSFRIDRETPEGWVEIFNGDAIVRVGRAFLNDVRVPLRDPKIRKLRFRCVSPANTGILLDDVRVVPLTPQVVKSVELVPHTLPVLVGTPDALLAKLTITVEGQIDPISLNRVHAILGGTIPPREIVSVSLLRGSHGRQTQAKSVATIAREGLGDLSKLMLECPVNDCVLQDGVNEFWVACELASDVDIDSAIGAAVNQVEFSRGDPVSLDAAMSMQRLGVAVRNGGDDGVHTYRIPGLATTNKGTLIGVYDVRHRNGGDLPGDIDVGMSRSMDGGRTWEPMQVIMDMGDDPAWNYDGVGDPAVLVDQHTGTIWVAATWSHGNRSWHGSGPGLNPEQTGQLLLVRSDDDGVTWSKPINITSQVKQPDWCFILQGPGKGITMRDGTLVFAAQYQDPPEQQRLPHSTIIYSKDHGTTWQAGTGAFGDTTEAQVVEVEPGMLMLNARYNRKSARVVMTTRDMGKTWQKHSTSERALIEPGACMASLIDVDRETNGRGGDWLLFSNPDSLNGRNHITIKASSDRGQTWPKEHRLLLDEGRSAGYSCLSMIDEDTIGILYEGSQAHMTFQRIPLSEVIHAKDPLANAEPRLPASADGRHPDPPLQLPCVFSDHMVLQADAPLPVWGKAIPGSSVVITLGQDSLSAIASREGDWQVCFPPRPATATPTTLVIKSREERLSFGDILIGEVWICAGQSNMEWRLNQSTNGQRELKALLASPRTNIRLLDLTDGPRGLPGSYSTEQLARLTPDRFVDGQWKTGSVDVAAEFTAVGWYFGRHLQQHLDVPIGLICPAVGGSPTEAWIPREGLSRNDELKALVDGHWLDNNLLGEFCLLRGEQNLLRGMQVGEAISGDDLGPNHPFKPGFLWSAAIEPLIPYAIRGVIWYQGESNAETPQRVRQHERLFPLLVREWRRQWKQGDFPFLFVQLPALNRPDWPLFRDGQRRVLNELENVGMAVTIDTGHRTDVHPTLKRPVGERLALWALGTTYRSATHTTYSGSLYHGAQRQGNAITVSFLHAEGLKSSDGRPLRHFEVCGSDGQFHPATATLTGNGKAVAVTSPQVAEPIVVRYAWQPYPDPPVNFVNAAGLPASPFTTCADTATGPPIGSKAP